MSPSLSSPGLSYDTKFVHIGLELRSSSVGDTILGVQSEPACTIYTNISLYRTVSYDILVTATAPVSACLHPTGCLAARTGRGEISQAGKHTSSKRRRYHTNTARNKMQTMLYFVETTHEVAETVIFRQYVPCLTSISCLILYLPFIRVI